MHAPVQAIGDEEVDSMEPSTRVWWNGVVGSEGPAPHQSRSRALGKGRPDNKRIGDPVEGFRRERVSNTHGHGLLDRILHAADDDTHEVQSIGSSARPTAALSRHSEFGASGGRVETSCIALVP